MQGIKNAGILFLFLFLLRFAGTGMLFAGGGQAGQDKVYEFSLGSAYDRLSPPFLAGVKFAEEVKAATNGKVIINTFSNSALGTEREQYIAVAANELDFTVGGILLVDMYCPEFGFMSAPYLYKDMEHIKKVYFSPLGDRMRAKFLNNNINLIGVTWRGQRHTSSNRPIRVPADIKGLKIRMTEMPSWVAIWGGEGLGGTTVPIVLGELYTSLQTGVVEASEGPYEQLANYKLQEVQKYLINTGHVQEWCGLFASEKMLKSLPPAYRKIIEEKAVACMTEYGSKLAADKANDFRMELIRGGMQEINVNVQEFTNAVLPVYDKFFRQTWTASTMAEVQSYAK
jgi:tripartite ATP-independent transporter DctP family solute receptor